jgi:23S rRNA-/tRNA-specific pseudouridylate synthase
MRDKDEYHHVTSAKLYVPRIALKGRHHQVREHLDNECLLLCTDYKYCTIINGYTLHSETLIMLRGCDRSLSGTACAHIT